MIALLLILLRVLVALAGLAVLAFRTRRCLEAENFALRRQLALYKERGLKPRRIDAATRANLEMLSKLYDWRSCLVVIRPETMTRWHRASGRPF